MRTRLMILFSAVFMAAGLAMAFAPGASAHTGAPVAAANVHSASEPIPADVHAVEVLPMSVGSGQQWAYSTSPWGLINAWNAGPWVRNYWGGTPTSTNDDFTNITLTPTTAHALMFSGLGDWVGQCIGDAFNDPGDARASLGNCGHNGIGENWGVDMTVGSAGCPAGWVYFLDTHWQYLGPASNTNGAQMYLNKPNKYCYDGLGAA